ncbi:hypothetical protein [Legionella taurinensis]|nr:hypothetical protein [Legionella taurinensis]MDX1837876.1 hypothetical protein [Legionella taurinensis]
MMSYNSIEVLSYTQKVCSLFQVAIPHSAELTSWQQAKQGINAAALQLKGVIPGITSHEERQRLFALLMIAIARAVNYVDKHPNYRSALDVYIGGALEEAKHFEALKPFKQPQFHDRTKPSPTPSIPEQAVEIKQHFSEEEKVAVASRMGGIFFNNPQAIKPLSDEEMKGLEEVNAFKASASYVTLCKYQTFLSKDPRKHWYKVPDKADNLAILIDALDGAKSETDIKHILSDFYAGKGREGTLYEKLNQGQGITSRFLGLFNSNTHTTTLELIDKLAKPFGLGNLVPSAPAPK